MDCTAWECLNMELFLACIFLYSDWIWIQETGKYGPEITPYLDTAYAVLGAVRNGKWQVLLQKQKNLKIMINTRETWKCLLRIFRDVMGSGTKNP